jgi:hypothetical protein
MATPSIVDVDENVINDSDETISVTLSDSEDRIPLPRGRSRKRKKDETVWRLNISKRRRTSGKEYTSPYGRKRLVSAKCVTGQPCGCKKLCFNLIADDRRENIVKDFYNIKTKDLQDSYLGGLVTVRQIARRRKKVPGSTKCFPATYLYKVSMCLYLIKIPISETPTRKALIQFLSFICFLNFFFKI